MLMLSVNDVIVSQKGSNVNGKLRFGGTIHFVVWKGHKTKSK